MAGVEYNILISHVLYHCGKHNTKEHDMASKVSDQALSDYASGVPLKTILEGYSVSKTQFYRRLKQCNIENRGQSERFDEKTWSEIVLKYKDKNCSLYDLAEEYKSCNTTISDGLKSRGVQVRTSSEAAMIYTNEQKDKAIENYMEGSTSEMAGSFSNISPSSILRWLKERGYKARQQHDYGGNQDFFVTLDNERSCYWFGFLCADGNIINTYVRTLLSSKDFDHLVFFHAHLDYSKPVKIFRSTRYWEDREAKEYEYALSLIGSNRIVKDLTRQGLILVKNGDFQPLDSLNDEQFKWFLRGYFDGDGSIYKDSRNNWHWYVCAQHRVLLNYIGKRIRCLKTVNVYSSGKYKGNIFRLVYAGNQIVADICEWLYGDSAVHLVRKHDLAMRCVGERVVR